MMIFTTKIVKKESELNTVLEMCGNKCKGKLRMSRIRKNGKIEEPASHEVYRVNRKLHSYHEAKCPRYLVDHH